MKKTYTKPESTAVRFDAMQMLASSPTAIQIIENDTTTEVDATESFSTGKTWGDTFADE